MTGLRAADARPEVPCFTGNHGKLAGIAKPRRTGIQPGLLTPTREGLVSIMLPANNRPDVRPAGDR